MHVVPKSNDTDIRNMLNAKLKAAFGDCEKRLFSGKIVKISNKHVYIDGGLKNLVVVPVGEIGVKLREVGKTVKFYLLNTDHKIANYKKALEKIMAAKIANIRDAGQVIAGEIVNVVNNGFYVNVELDESEDSIMCFLPHSHSSISGSVDNLIVGSKVEVVFSKQNVKQKGYPVVSIKERIQQDLTETSEMDWQIGQRVNGIVKTITKYGVFVALASNKDGLIYKKDIAWHEVKNIEEYFKLEEKIVVEIKEIIRENNDTKIGLSTRFLHENTFNNFKVGEVVECIEPTIENTKNSEGKTQTLIFALTHNRHRCLILPGEYSWNSKITAEETYSLLSKKDRFNLYIVDIDKEEMMLKCSYKKIISEGYDKVNSSVAELGYAMFTPVSLDHKRALLKNQEYEIIVTPKNFGLVPHQKMLDAFQSQAEIPVKVLDINKQSGSFLIPGLKGGLSITEKGYADLEQIVAQKVNKLNVIRQNHFGSRSLLDIENMDLGCVVERLQLTKNKALPYGVAVIAANLEELKLVVSPQKMEQAIKKAKQETPSAPSTEQHMSVGDLLKKQKDKNQKE